MYNQNLKSSFIANSNFANSNVESLAFFFERTEQYETEIGKDLCYFSLEEAIDVIVKTSGARVASKNANLYRLKSYLKWCEENGIKNIDQRIITLNVVDWGVSGIKNRMVANPKGLQAFLDSVFEKEECKTVDNIYRCYYWMAFMGIRESDTISIKTNDVDLNLKRLVCHGVNYPIYDESIAVFKNCAELEEMILRHPNYDDVIKWRADGDILLRGFSSPKTTRPIRSAISRKMKSKLTEDSVILSYQRAYLSGVFYRARHWEIDNTKVPDFSEIVKKDMDINEDGVAARKKIARMTKGYLSDYENWKKAFGV